MTFAKLLEHSLNITCPWSPSHSLRLRCVLWGMLCVFGTVFSLPAQAGICLERAKEAEQAFGIPELMLQSIILQESGDNPLALNVDGQAIYPADKQEAQAAIRHHLQQAGNVDIGCGQISMKYHSTYFSIEPLMALDPWINVVYASKVLLENYKAYGSWTKAVAHYHSGNEQRQRDYLCRIMRHMARLEGYPYHCN